MRLYPGKKPRMLKDVPKELQEDIYEVSRHASEYLEADPGLQHIPDAIECFDQVSVRLRGIAKKLREYDPSKTSVLIKAKDGVVREERVKLENRGFNVKLMITDEMPGLNKRILEIAKKMRED